MSYTTGTQSTVLLMYIQMEQCLKRRHIYSKRWKIILRGGKQSKKRMTIAAFVATDGSKHCNPVIIWRSQLPRYFRKSAVPTRPAALYYFANAKSWITTEIMERILG